ncbi:MAG: hypothetical protein IGQ45_08015 [Cyanobacterium sp. T60_A2020_053]|nr:hypothetical protein [Cyanobacterium sp. T60_A2020_053]
MRVRVSPSALVFTLFLSGANGGYSNGDTVNINGDINTNDFSIDQVQHINFASGKAITTNDIGDSGDITWIVGQTINLNGSSTLTTTNGEINLTAQGTATGNYQGIVLNGSTITSDQGAIDINGTGQCFCLLLRVCCSLVINVIITCQIVYEIRCPYVNNPEEPPVF